MPKLIEQRYGKGAVRVLKILRDGAGAHRIKDIEVTALLKGDFATFLHRGRQHQGCSDRHDQEHDQRAGEAASWR